MPTATSVIPTSYDPLTSGGTVTSWLPITSTWPAVPKCSSAIYLQTGPSPNLIAFDPYYGQSIDTKLTCAPPAVTTWWDALPTLGPTVTRIAPLSCPEQYTTASSSTMSGGLMIHYACCPSGYEYQGTTKVSETAQCTSALALEQVFSFQSYIASRSQWVAVTSTVNVTTGTILGVPINGFISATAAMSSSSKSTAASTSASSKSTSSSTGGLSSGAKAGIGVGVTVGVLMILGFVLLLILRRRKARKTRAPSLSGPGVGDQLDMKAELPANPNSPVEAPSEPIKRSDFDSLPSSARYELSGLSSSPHFEASS